jgi:hypothetical protein
MKVYLAKRCGRDCVDPVEGVFSTQEKADAFKAAWDAIHDRGEGIYLIEAMELDGFTLPDMVQVFRYTLSRRGYPDSAYSMWLDRRYAPSEGAACYKDYVISDSYTSAEEAKEVAEEAGLHMTMESVGAKIQAHYAITRGIEETI